MRVGILYESSGRVRTAMAARGHYAISFDVLSTELPGLHVQGDLADVDLAEFNFDLIIAHPPCTYLANSSVQWLFNTPLHPKPGVLYGAPRQQAMRNAAATFERLLQGTAAPKVAIENPIMHCYARELISRPYTQIIQPWQFGHREMKATCLWLRGLPPLVGDNVVGPPPTDPIARRAWAVVHRTSPGPERARNRSRTYLGVAAAMAEQWG